MVRHASLFSQVLSLTDRHRSRPAILRPVTQRQITTSTRPSSVLGFALGDLKVDDKPSVGK